MKRYAFGAALIAGLAGWSGVGAADTAIQPPPVPFEDHGACPFECCTYRTWTVEADTAVRADRRDGAPVAFRLRKGERVDGLTGVVITRKLGKAIVREPVTTGPDQLKLSPGDTPYVLHYVGEGAWKAWARGQLFEAEMAPLDQACAGPRRPGGLCAMQIVEDPVTEWWARVRNHGGREGWTRELDHFGNKDACG